jgi:6-phosphogluconolactonase
MAPDLRVFPTAEILSREVAEAFVRDAASSDRFALALAGGSTPRLLYRLLATEFRERVPWSRVHLFWSDERYVPRDHPDSNYRMVREALLDHVPIPDGNVYPAPTDLERPEDAAAQYEADLKEFFGTTWPRFDWMLLGLGEDGHVASLFPGSKTLAEKERWVIAVNQSPKPPPLRLTFTFPVINHAAHIQFLVAGKGKRSAVRSTLEGARDPLRVPAQNVQPSDGSLTWWLDEESAP